MVKKSILIHLNRDCELLQKWKRMIHLIVSKLDFQIFWTLPKTWVIQQMQRTKQKVLFGLGTQFKEKITNIDTFYKTKDLKIHKLINDLQDFEINHLVPKKGKAVIDKGKSLALKYSKSRSRKEKVISMARNHSSNPQEE